MTVSHERKPPIQGDWDAFLHEHVRSPELRRLPAGAKTVLSGGAAGSWYFDWFNACYPTQVERHIAVEAFAPEPEDLPSEVEWLARTLGDLEPVADGEVDLVYGGEVLEHLWPEEAVGFLLEARRVLRVGGRIALDSPNRRVTTAVDWLHPEHTVEFAVDEAVELLAAAGFVDIEIRGGWLTYDEASHRFLPLDLIEETGSWPWRRRLEEAADHPDDSFIWWAVAQKTDAAPDPERLEKIVWRAFSTYRAFRFSRLQNEIGDLKWLGGATAVRTAFGEAGYLIVGPKVPMPPGAAAARFHLAVRGSPERPTDNLVTLEVTTENGSHTVTRRTVTAAELPPDGSLAEVHLPFEFKSTVFGVEFRVASMGRPNVAVEALLRVEVEPETHSLEEARPSMQDRSAADASTRPEEPDVPPPAADGPSAIRRIAQFVLWPAMRFFDPRFRGISTQVSVTHDDLAERISEVSDVTVRELRDLARELEQLHASVAEVDRLARSEIEMAADATTMMGEALDETLELVRKLPDDAIAAYIERLSQRKLDELDPAVEQLLNFAESHRGFAAQRHLWFNSPVSISYEDRDVMVGDVNERIVELPYVLRALGGIPTGVNVLDVGATESLLSLYLASLGYHVTALDPRPYPLRHPRLEVAVAEAQRWEPKKTFDAVVCLSTIEHIGLGAYGEAKEGEGADLEAMNRIRTWTAPGGLLVLTTPFGDAQTDTFTRVYDRASLKELLNGWAVSDLTIARRKSDATWLIDDDPVLEPGAEAVALVTAISSET
jgi:2-polyprenyl-3-methyl-5-hydroxy-6-metoxy-1,4-benzoquinol methylase